MTPKKFFYDTVHSGSKAAFTCALEGVWHIEWLGLPKVDTDKILHHNARALFGFAH